MHLFATLIFTSLSFFVEATPTLSSPGFAVPISQRTRVGKDANGFVDVTRLQGGVGQSIAFIFLTIMSVPRLISHIRYLSRKLNRGFQAYEKNTGTRHPSAPELSHSEKRSTGSDTLVDLKWYGNISVGTPTMNFTGKLSLLTLQPLYGKLENAQLTLIRGAVIFFFLAPLATVLAPGMHCMTPLKVPLSMTLGHHFTCNTMTILELRARCIQMMSPLLVIRSACASGLSTLLGH